MSWHASGISMHYMHSNFKFFWSSSTRRTCEADKTSDVLMLPAGQVANVDGPVYGSCAETSKQKNDCGAILQTLHQNYQIAEAQNINSSNKFKYKCFKDF